MSLLRAERCYRKINDKQGLLRNTFSDFCSRRNRSGFLLTGIGFREFGGELGKCFSDVDVGGGRGVTEFIMKMVFTQQTYIDMKDSFGKL